MKSFKVTDAETIAKGCGGAKRTGAGWTCDCPTGNHNTPAKNLSVRTDTEGGRVLVHCHAGCSQDAVIDALRALGLWWGENSPTYAGGMLKPALKIPTTSMAMSKKVFVPVPDDAPLPPKEHPQLGRPDHLYKYDDAEGRLISIVCRWNAKGIEPKEIRPLSFSDGAWKWQALPTPRPLFGLKELADNLNASVLIVEGEKAALAARVALGKSFIVVTWQGGAKAVTTAEWAPLDGRDIIIWPDNDPAGLAAAEAILRKFPNTVVLDVSTLPKGGDAADLKEDEVRRIVQEKRLTSGTDQKKEELKNEQGADSSEEVCSRFKATEQGNAERLCLRHGQDLRYCYESGRWYVWDGMRWAVDSGKAIDARMQETSRAIWHEAAYVQKDERASRAKWAGRSESRNSIRAAIDLARTRCEVKAEALDSSASDYLLNLRNGTFDVRDGLLLPHDRGDMITMLAGVEYDAIAKCPKFLAFLNQIMEDDTEKIRFLQCWLGCCLTGDISNHKLVIWHGATARNGKSQLRIIVQAVMGDYYREADETTFLERKQGGKGAPRTDLLLLKGTRFVVVNEPNRGERLDGAQIKKTTGGESDTARDNYKGYSLKPNRVTCHLNIITNDLPQFTGDDAGMVERLLVLPFDYHIPVEDRIPDFGKLIADEEGSGILNWILEGADAWWKAGRKFSESPTVCNATRSYTLDNNPVQRFCAERVRKQAGAWTATGTLFDAFNHWRTANGEGEIGLLKFSKIFAKLRYKATPHGKAKGYADITLSDGSDGPNINSSTLTRVGDFTIQPSLPSPELPTPSPDPLTGTASGRTTPPTLPSTTSNPDAAQDWQTGHD